MNKLKEEIIEDRLKLIKFLKGKDMKDWKDMEWHAKGAIDAYNWILDKIESDII